MNVLITGSCGFIGYHLSRRFLKEGHTVIGFDAMTSYYDPELKRARLAGLRTHNGFSFSEARLEEEGALEASVERFPPDLIIHLAAQPGVRYSLENPKAYIDSNIIGSWRVMELARQMKPRHLMLASTSSIYGANAKIPFSESDRADEQLSLYAATKKGMEAIAHSYSHLHNIPTTAFRFFTVYGTWGRPDMAIFKFTRNIIAGEAIDVYGAGNMRRDFTCADDLVEAIVRLAPLAPEKQAQAPFRVVNIGGGQPVGLNDFIETIETVIGKKAIRNELPMQPGDVPVTYAAPDLLKSLTGYVPATPLAQGVRDFVEWYRGYYKV
jgi:UDP-glucuronate 4-epimerase